jgi:hypothetical protein
VLGKDGGIITEYILKFDPHIQLSIDLENLPGNAMVRGTNKSQIDRSLTHPQVTDL